MTGKRRRGGSPELTGGGGFIYEANVAAYYLVGLLTEGSAEGLSNRPVRRVALQQNCAGEPLDDVIVDAGGVDDMRLSLQVKRELKISSAATNADFREIVINSWRTLQKPDFRDNVDRYGAATGTISSKRLRELRRVCNAARNSLTPETFLARGQEGGNEGKSFQGIVNDFREILTSTGVEVGDHDLHRLLKHFVLVQFDFLAEEAAHPFHATERLRGILPEGDALHAAGLWQHLVGIARDGAAIAAEYDRARVLALVAGNYRLLPAPSTRADLQLLAQFSTQGIDSVVADIGGVHLARTGLAEQVQQRLEKHHYVQIQGLPGTGKSVLLRELAVRHRDSGAVLFLKSDRLHGNSWTEFAAALGLTTRNLHALLADIAASGPPILFLDGIDRIGGPQRNIVIDLLNAMFSVPDCRWKVVATLRDTGIEPLRNWLPPSVTNAVGIGSISVSSLNDSEALILARRMPSLQPLLFGNPKIRDIARRPFFAAVLVKAATSEKIAPFNPQSETDLMNEWWCRGGYGADATAVFLRQRTLLEIARSGVRRMGLNITLGALSAEAATQLASLIDDGIIQDAGNNRFKFAHDIFFEWAFYQELKGQEDQWIATLAELGEPPVLGRVVELLGQSSFANKTWGSDLRRIEASSLRSQWRRAWLLAPLTSPEFEDHVEDFESIVATDGYQRLGQLLVWFQAERTTPDAQILSGERLGSSLPLLDAIRYADRFGWPSDFNAWRQLIDWLIDREPKLPARLVPDLLSVFEVWQNPFADHPNPTSQKIVAKSLEWLVDIEARQHPERWSGDFGRWRDLLGDTLDDLERSLRELVLRAARAYPDLVRAYLRRLVDSRVVRQSAFPTAITYSPLLAQVFPDDVVDLVRAEILQLLPKDQLAEWEEEQEQRIRDLNHIRAIPESKRTKSQRVVLSSPPYIASDLSDHHWRNLSLGEHSGEYFPASPLREPFPSLFRHAPRQARELVRTLCNHAITAWRQLHDYTRMERGTPLSFELQFPWGRQTFWGDRSQYEWYRGRHGVEIVESGLMALEQWAFDELSAGQTVDEVVQAVVEGHESWTVLGIATALCLEKQHVSPVSAALLSCQRLWEADLVRQMHDEPGHQSNLMGFGGLGGRKTADRPHMEAVRAGNQRACRQWTLRDLALHHVVAADRQIRAQVHAAIADFPNNLPFFYAEEQHDPEHVARLRASAESWAEFGKQENYRAVPSPEPDDSRILIEFDNPRAKQPDMQAALAQSSAVLQTHSLWVWVDGCFKSGKLSERFSVDNAVRIARSMDRPDLFVPRSDDETDMTAAAVAGVASLIKCFADEGPLDVSAWASDVVARVGAAPKGRLDHWSSHSMIPWHPGVSAARALACDVKRGRDPQNAARAALYSLCAHPLETVSVAALEAALSCWDRDSRFAWIALDLGMRIARGVRRRRKHEQSDNNDGFALEIDQLVAAAQRLYERGAGYPEISLPASPWVYAPRRRSFGLEDAEDVESVWQHSDDYWRAEFASKVMDAVPLARILSAPDRREQFLCLLDGLLAWTLEYIDPPWRDKSAKRDTRKHDLGLWIANFSRLLACVAESLNADETIARYLKPVFGLDDELSASFLHPFVSRTSVRILDDEQVSSQALDLLMACTERIIIDEAFRTHRMRGEIFGHDLAPTISSLLFVAILDADGARRFANGDWKDVSSVLSIVDKLVQAAGWKPFVASEFLKLCEHSGDHYPTELFADQILHILGNGHLPGWRNTILASRIAGQIQVRADASAPLSPSLAQKLLRILDLLIDMGDRRSAALQVSDAFKDVRIQL